MISKSYRIFWAHARARVYTEPIFRSIAWNQPRMTVNKEGMAEGNAQNNATMKASRSSTQQKKLWKIIGACSRHVAIFVKTNRVQSQTRRAIDEGQTNEKLTPIAEWENIVRWPPLSCDRDDYRNGIISGRIVYDLQAAASVRAHTQHNKYLP